MCAAARKAKTSNDLNSMEHKHYRIFIFYFAVTFFHELGHVFITFLSLGDENKGTPPELIPKLAGILDKMYPEAGNSLEGFIFGGSVQHGRDDDYDDTQASLYMLCLMEDFKGKLTHALARRASPSQRGQNWPDLTARNR